MRLAVSFLAAVALGGCESPARNAGPVPPPAREPSLIRDMVELYRENPAKAFRAYRDKPQLVTGIRPRKTTQLAEFPGLYTVACDLEGGETARAADFDMVCTEDEAAALEVGRVAQATLVLKPSDLPTARPVFFTPAGVEKLGEETRRRQRGN